MSHHDPYWSHLLAAHIFGAFSVAGAIAAFAVLIYANVISNQ